ncbi:PaREP1 family protein [Pyrobaculum neutrophilum]|uniref:PaREP1 family protein n=1 Tax=Pyrobaculum neutrophilum (strain DSM 2338 / JCM 9278 / NBRC 100436 / V24Sta) TaxID=444157 RepID=B1YCD8_PYRNV|nr:PaREP1 family protein [Pyrobaculum neutrophilum]ACB39451.1 PaREP1 family protein [Pyrobaculum neutrophilum V24Sta]
MERPLPRPTEEGYVAARLLEALVEAKLALDFLQRGLVRNAAGKAFQAWRAYMAALLRLELEKLKAAAKSEEERRWLVSRAVPGVPTGRMKGLSQMLEEVGHVGLSLWTDRALHLHDYQHHGPDPAGEYSKYSSREEAARDVVTLIRELVGLVDAIKTRAKWTEELEKALGEVKRQLA